VTFTSHRGEIIVIVYLISFGSRIGHVIGRNGTWFGLPIIWWRTRCLGFFWWELHLAATENGHFTVMYNEPSSGYRYAALHP